MAFYTMLTFLGMISGVILFLRTRFLKHAQISDKSKDVCAPSISVIIPMRNEEHNIAGLLYDLSMQTVELHEVICIDDASTDSSIEISRQYNVKIISITKKPQGWIGKSYACHVGVKNATGERLLFLDADVRLKKDAVESILQTEKYHGKVISVQPWHTAVRWCEQMCLFFNMIAGFSLASKPILGKQTKGLFGPLIWIPKDIYQKSGGHKSVKSSILDDVSLGRQLDKIGIVPYCCIGDYAVRYRMYPYGFFDMLHGWTKNMASGVKHSSFSFICAAFLLITALGNVPLRLVEALILGQNTVAIYWLAWYVVTCLYVVVVGRKIGKFQVRYCLLYPLALMMFVSIVCLSTVKKMFRRPVRWKGRNISVND